jgi:hypothetical protein
MDAWVWIVIAVAAVVVLALIAFALEQRRRRRHLQDRFGPEYERTVEDADSRRRAEKDLQQRTKEHDRLELRPLSEGARKRYGEQWTALQAHFVDRPQVAVVDAEELVTQVMHDRGYPVEDFESQADLVSVDHPDVVENYRRAHSIYARQTNGTASTEDLRQAVVCYRALFDELLNDSEARSTGVRDERSV